ncbi:ankyrin repeat-containing domain protein, partial [Phyllosticta citriasiana]|uniref:ankyrin repeat-containing domain protein n=1 Tax=Phyllosticta citriasiana TaxID=595635 RepID=UPI0030FD972B
FLHIAANCGALDVFRVIDDIPPDLWRATCTWDNALIKKSDQTLENYEYTEKDRVLLHDCSLPHLSTKDTLRHILKADIFNVDCPAGNGVTALHMAALRESIESAKIVLSHGANVNAITSCRTSPLHFAASHSVSLCNWLIRCGARPTSMDQSGNLPLHVAASGGHDSIVSTLLQEGPVHIPNRAGMTPEICALAAGHGYTAESVSEAGQVIGLLSVAVSQL